MVSVYQLCKTTWCPNATIANYDVAINQDWEDILYIVPMYVKEGTMIPSIELEQYVGEKNEKGEQRETEITHSYLEEKQRQITIKRMHDGYCTILEIYFIVEVLTIKSGDKELDYVSDQNMDALKQRRGNAWFYREDTHITYIKVMDNNLEIVLDVQYKSLRTLYGLGKAGFLLSARKVSFFIV